MCLLAATQTKLSQDMLVKRHIFTNVKTCPVDLFGLCSIITISYIAS